MSGPSDPDQDLLPQQDYILIGGDKSPGKATVRNLSQSVPWDIRKGYGLTGASVVPKGDDLATFDIVFEMWDGVDVGIWMLFYFPKYFSAAAKFIAGSKTAKALGIQHPVLAQLGISEVVVTKRGGLEQDETGLWSATIGFLQYRKPKPALQAPIGTIKGAGAPAISAPDANEIEIAKLQAEVQAKHNTEAGLP